ncbi:hypothetical protein NP233_g5134 [Leucocoprinus birnbaumii]|uniref:Uncharacterized protein n=1 Tax=Leucocoprinus birnbaumii TaxID=56174 RepID=A0AAD5VTE1_9AGAR|nr:hypothetical protein NP233_g5134 [Leucocoprinus birnbaumii]
MQHATSSMQPNRQPVPPAKEQRGRTISLLRLPPANSNPKNEPMVPMLLNSQPMSSTSQFTTAARSMSTSTESSGVNCLDY